MSVLRKYNKEVSNNMITPVDKQKQLTPNPTFDNTNFNVDNPSPLVNSNPVPYDKNKVNSALVDKFDKTSLDLEDSRPVGGPNRTNAASIPGGNYQVTSTNGPLVYKNENLAGKPGGAIVSKDLNQFTPNNTYIDFIANYKNDNR